MNVPGVQVGSALHIVNRKFEMISPPARSVRDLGVELHAEDRSRLVLEGADRISVALGGDPVSLGRLLDVIAVAHPRRHGLAGVEPGENPDRLDDPHRGASVLSRRSVRITFPPSMCAMSCMP